jgi:hypothetical protein
MGAMQGPDQGRRDAISLFASNLRDLQGRSVAAVTKQGDISPPMRSRLHRVQNAARLAWHFAAVRDTGPVTLAGSPVDGYRPVRLGSAANK